MSRLRLLLLVVAAVGACGVPNDDRPRFIAAEEAPVDLSPPTSAPSDTNVGRETAVVFFINPETGTLQGVDRRVPSVSPAAVLAALFDGLLNENEQLLLDTAIPDDVQLIDAVLEDNVLLVNLTPAPPSGIQSVVGQTSLQAFAQMVRTAIALSGVQAVRFAVEGSPILAPTDSGPVERPVTRGDYASLLPLPGG